MYGMGISWYIKMPLGMPTSYICIPGFKSWLHSLFKFPDNAHTGSQQVIAQIVGSLTLTWKIWGDFPSPSFNWAQPLTLWAFVGYTSRWEFSVSLSLSVYLSNKKNKFKVKKKMWYVDLMGYYSAI